MGCYIKFSQNTGYISQRGDHYKADIPIFLPEDEWIITEISDHVSKIARDFIDQNYSEIKRDLNEITPLVNKITFEEIFVDVWHKMFGYCNIYFAEEGFIYDPPETPYHARYLPWVTIKERQV